MTVTERNKVLHEFPVHTSPVVTTVTWAVYSGMVDEIVRLRAERDALRKVDVAMVERAAKAFYEQGKRFAWADVSTLSRSMWVAGARAALDAALAVQPSTGAAHE